MKRRLMIWMIAVFVPLLSALTLWMSEQSFALSMAREQERAQMNEALIASQVRQNVHNLGYNQVVQAARQYRSAYAAQGVELIFCYNSMPIGGAALPNRLYESMLTGVRCALLDTLSQPQRYAIAEPLTDELTLIVLHDVSGLYGLRTELRQMFIGAAALGAAAVALISWLVASGFTRPIRRLTEAAQALGENRPRRHVLPLKRKDELGMLARSFEDMRKAVEQREAALEQESNARQAMLDALAHEMRTPLCALLGNARLMQEELPSAERRAIAEEMAHEIRRLSEMDEQLMKMMHLRNEPLETEDVALLPLLNETANRLKTQANGVELRVDGRNSVIAGDRALLSLLADNLAVNAIRASGAGQTVTLTALVDGFRVSDSGVGMTREQLAHIFEPFYKADKARTRKHGGAGLGLTLCRQIAQLHGGGLDVQSEPGKGTAVTFTTSLHPVADSVTRSDVSYPQEVKHP